MPPKISYFVKRRPALILALVLLAPLARGAETPKPEGRYDLLLVDLDGISPEASEPELGEAALQALRFDRAYSASDRALPGAVSLLTSQYAPAHRVARDEDALSTGTATLAEILSRDGYATAGFLDDPALDAGRGFARGFDRYEIAASTGAPRRVFDAAARWADEPRAGRWFLFVRAGGPPRAAAEEFAALWRKWRDDGTLKHAIVILTADAGEAGAPALSERALRVPLLIWGPGIAAARIEGTARLIDAAPSLLDWAGLPAAPSFDGTRLEPLAAGRETKPRYAFAASGGDAAHFDRYSAVGGDWKLVYDKTSGEAKLYDLVSDSGETKDASDARPEIALDLTQRLLSHIREASSGDSTRKTEASPELLKQLRQRGYW